MSIPRDRVLAEVLRRQGHQRLFRFWAKLEILLGLAASGIGLMIGIPTSLAPPTISFSAVVGVLLFTLGGYLALAGHRSHLYQSANQQVALLVEVIRHERNPAENP